MPFDLISYHPTLHDMAISAAAVNIGLYRSL